MSAAAVSIALRRSILWAPSDERPAGMPARARHDEQRIARRWAICAIASRSSEAIYATAAVSDGALLEGCVAYFLVHALQQAARSPSRSG